MAKKNPGKSKFRDGDHVINKRGKHGNVTEIVDSVGTEMPKVKWRDGGSETVFDSEISGTGMCGNGGRNCQS